MPSSSRLICGVFMCEMLACGMPDKIHITSTLHKNTCKCSSVQCLIGVLDVLGSPVDKATCLLKLSRLPPNATFEGEKYPSTVLQSVRADHTRSKCIKPHLRLSPPPLNKCWPLNFHTARPERRTHRESRMPAGKNIQAWLLSSL